jgi:hypothetical protein
MATITANSLGSHLNTARRSYITTSPFHNNIYQYTTSYNSSTNQTTGTLTTLATVGTANASNCPANRVLIETGKKLYPSTVYGTTNGVYATPDNTNYGAPWPGVTTYMVGVLDPNTLLSGFIDPNSKIFAIFNSDCPTYVPRGVDVSGTVVDEGAPVITLGSVTGNTIVAVGANLDLGEAAITATNGDIVATSGQIRASYVQTLTQNGTNTLTLDTRLGQYVTVTINSNSNFALGASNTTLVGSVIYVKFRNTGAYTPTITLGGGIRESSVPKTATASVVGGGGGTVTVVNPYGGPTLVLTSGVDATMTFVCDGTSLLEVSRVPALQSS